MPDIFVHLIRKASPQAMSALGLRFWDLPFKILGIPKYVNNAQYKPL